MEQTCYIVTTFTELVSFASVTQRRCCRNTCRNRGVKSTSRDGCTLIYEQIVSVAVEGQSVAGTLPKPHLIRGSKYAAGILQRLFFRPPVSYFDDTYDERATTQLASLSMRKRSWCQLAMHRSYAAILTLVSRAEGFSLIAPWLHAPIDGTYFDRTRDNVIC